MKESNFYSDDFEQLIREKTEQYKMYPSEKVWKGVHSSLHTKRKWFFGSMAILVTGILFYAGKELITPTSHAGPIKKIASLTTPADESSSRTVATNRTHTSFTTYRGNTSTVRHSVQTDADLSPEDQQYKEVNITVSHPVITQPDLSEDLSHKVNLPSEAPALPVIAGKTGFPEAWMAKAAEEGAPAGAVNSGIRAGTEGSGTVAPAARTYTDGSVVAAGSNPTAKEVIESLSARGTEARTNLAGRGNLANTKDGQDRTIRKGSISGAAGEGAKASSEAIAEAIDRQRINWLHDYAVYTLTPGPQRNRTYLQLTLAPTVNYRNLSGGEVSPKAIQQGGPFSPMRSGDASSYVDHSPALGFEVGGSLLYRITRNLSIKGGLQFNFSRYTIKAYASSPRQTTLGLRSPYGYFLDSITAPTNISNLGGSSLEKLNNDYYQLSAPIGFELRVLGNERLQVNVAATIQPTYLLNTNPYMLSPDYTSYTKYPSYFRRWNWNTSVEAFLSYRMGGVRLQVGPEFRYQLLSTYTNNYSLHENLKGYGLKIGITKVLP